jgi:subtilisin family serine protease
MWTHLLSGCLCVLLILPQPLRAGHVQTLTQDAASALEALPPGQTLRVIVHLADRADLSRTARASQELRRRADLAQAGLREWLQGQQARGQVADFRSFWIFNGLAVTASGDVIRQIAARPEVTRVALNAVITVPNRAQAAESPGDNLEMIGAPAAWARGITGQGIVVALLDSGVDMSHPDLAARWRGGANSWFDPYGEHPDEPFDVNGHGTQTLGVILGSEVGVAPGAQWIAARVFDDRDRATVENIHRALQWVLDPDGDPATDDAPQVVNNSWSFVNAGCNPEFAGDLRALRAAGILPVFAAGVRDSVSPANTADAFAVGSLEDATTIARDSPRGPSICGASIIFPSVVAPGERIHTTDRFGLYTTLGGTSLAAAHVSSALALILSADAALSAEEQQAILIETAVDLGEPGPDAIFGYGRIDVAAALDRILGIDPARQATASASATQPQNLDAGLLAVGAGGLLAMALIGLSLARRSARR